MPDPIPDAMLRWLAKGEPDNAMELCSLTGPNDTLEIRVAPSSADLTRELLALRDAVRALVVDAEPTYTSHDCDGSTTCLCPAVCAYCSAKRDFYSHAAMEHEPTCPVLAARAHLP